MVINALPLFSEAGKKERAGYRHSIQEFSGYSEKAATPEDKAVLDRTVKGLEGELLQMQVGHGLETVGLIAAQVGGCALLPCLLTGNSTAIIASGGLLFGGMIGYIGGILATPKHSGAALIRASGGDTQTIVKYRNPALYQELFGAPDTDKPKESAESFVNRLAMSRILDINYHQDYVDIDGQEIGVRQD